MFTCCLDRYLPGESPYELNQPGVSSATRAAAMRSKIWEPAGRTLRVRFLDGEPTLQQKVIRFAQEWSAYANLQFDFGDHARAEIRISFQWPGSWSFIGTDALGVLEPEPTMNFGWLHPGTPNDEVRRVVLHEFGHALGLIHEHQNPAATIPWNRAAVYDYYAGPPNNWTAEQVEVNLFQTYAAELTQHSAFDPHSIMLYPIPAEFTEGGFSVGLNQTLSTLDRAYIGAWYPFPPTVAATPEAEAAPVTTAPPASVAERFIVPSLRNQPFVDLHQVPPNVQRLHWNESPFDFPAALKAEVLRRLERAKWSEYPPKMRPYDLIARLAAKHNVPSESVVLSNGSSDVLRIVMTAVLQPGDVLLTVTPTFYAYKLWGDRLGAKVHEVALSPANDFALPVDRLITLAQLCHAKLIVLATPNNPTGTAYPPTALRSLVNESDALLLIDEAYAEFCGQDLQPLLAKNERVILLRTFSKAFSMAGVRLGYALCTPALGVEFQKATTVFTLNLFAETVATVALENEAYFQAQVSRIGAERQALALALGTIPGVEVLPSAANFLLIRLDRPARPLAQQLLAQERLLVGALGDPGMEHYLRISVGTAPQNEALVAAVRRYL